MNYQEALNEWLEWGGYFWHEYSFTGHPENDFMCTRDEIEAEAYYQCRDMELYKNTTLDEMCKIWARNAMEQANETEENINKYLDW